MSDKHWGWTARGIVVVNWLAMVLVMSTANVPKGVAMSLFGVFRISAVCACAYLIYESSLVTQKRTSVSGLIVDGLLVLPMFLFWLAVRAATF
jgi:hypothetical protein